MTKLGKWLVLINVSLSVMFLAWAVGLYTNHVNWNTPPADGGQRVQGMVDELKEQINRLVAARDAADARFFDAAGRVQALEVDRPNRQRFYADLYRSAQSGDVATIKPAVQVLPIGQGGALTLRPSNRPIEIDGQPALAVAAYRAAVRDRLSQITAAQNQVTALIAETKALTERITGIAPAGGGERVTAEQKGLRGILGEQEKVAKDVQLEQQYLRSPITNLSIDVDLLRKRQASLAARLQEIEKSGTALGRAP